MNNFEQQGLSPELLRAIGDLGFETPTPIQEKTIKTILESRGDLIALAQTGTGKTAAFSLPIIQQVKTSERAVQALVLCPTRELCLQITNDMKNFSKYVKGLHVEAVYGGTSIVPQIKSIKSGVHIIVGTPGRTLDLIERQVLKVDSIKWLVLDESDEMLQMGFKDDLDSILSTTPKDKQTLLFSATMPQGVRHIAGNYMNNPEEISVGKKNQGADNVEHHLYMVKASDRYLALKRLADINPDIYGIVFCRTRSETKEIADKLIQDSYNADALHGDLSQAQRDHVMARFRSKHLQILVATDVAARGLDVNDLTHVINYNLPDDPEIYIHRSGRTGRAGKSGISIAITHSREGRKIKDLERILGKKFEPKLVPGGREICEKRLFNMIDKIENITVDYKQIESFMPVIFDKLACFDREELIRRFVSVEFNHFMEYYRNASDINVQADTRSRDDRSRDDRGRERTPRDRGDRNDRNDRFSDRESSPRERSRNMRSSNFSRFYINLGTKHRLNASSLIGIINDQTQNRDIEIGKIDILRKFSFFEVDSRYEKEMMNSFEGLEFEDEPIVLQLSQPDDAQKFGAFKSEGSDYSRPKREYSSFDNNDSRKRKTKFQTPAFDKGRPKKRNFEKRDKRN